MTVATMSDTVGTKLDPDTLSVQTKIEGGKLIVTMPCKDGSTDIFIITKNIPSVSPVNTN